MLKKLNMTWVKRAVTAILLTVAVLLIYGRLRHLDVAELWAALQDLSGKRILLALLLIVADYLLLSGFDFLSLRYIGKQLSFTKVFSSSFISYTFNFNLGSLVGGFAFRYRMYSLWGISPGDIGRILAVSIASNWIGYLTVAGIVFTFGHHAFLESWISSSGLKAIGLLCLALASAYIILCFRFKKSLRIGRWSLEIPSWKFGSMQILLAGSHWILVTMIIYVLWSGQGNSEYAQILITYLVAAIAGVITHIPAGLGVTEAVFVEAFSPQVTDAFIVATLLVFRLLYHILPLILALGLYIGIEVKRRHH